MSNSNHTNSLPADEAILFIHRLAGIIMAFNNNGSLPDINTNDRNQQLANPSTNTSRLLNVYKDNIYIRSTYVCIIY